MCLLNCARLKDGGDDVDSQCPPARLSSLNAIRYNLHTINLYDCSYESCGQFPFREMPF